MGCGPEPFMQLNSLLGTAVLPYLALGLLHPISWRPGLLKSKQLIGTQHTCRKLREKRTAFSSTVKGNVSQSHLWS